MKIQNHALSALAALLFCASANATLLPTPAGPFLHLDDSYVATIYSLSSQGSIGLGWDSNGQLWRANGGSSVYVHSTTADTTVHGTNTIHSSTVHTITGAGLGGYGMSLGNDGFMYAQSGSGLVKINTTTFVSTHVPGTAAGSFGLKTLPDGKIAYNANDNSVHVYDPVTGIDVNVYNSGQFNDDLAITSDGHILVAVLGVCRTDVITETGVLVRSITTSHCADGMAFGGGKIFKNNTDGTLTTLTFAGPNFSGAFVESVIADGFVYGDFAAVGPDNAFYINVGDVKFADGAHDGFYSLVRIAAVDGGGFGGDVPEPGSLALAALAFAAIGAVRKVRKH